MIPVVIATSNVSFKPQGIQSSGIEQLNTPISDFFDWGTNPKKNYAIFSSSTSSFRILENIDRREIIVDNFVRKLTKSAIDIDQEIYKMVDENFWSLL